MGSRAPKSALSMPGAFLLLAGRNPELRSQTQVVPKNDENVINFPGFSRWLEPADSEDIELARQFVRSACRRNTR